MTERGGTMFRKIFLTTVILTFAFTAVAIAADATIIGAGKCKTCHKKPKAGEQFKIWSASKHANAYETLKSEKSIAIAKEKGLGNPWEEAACLKCHTTKDFLGAAIAEKTKYVIEEGVSCEACHGAGSNYKKKSVMKDHDAAVAAGLIVEGESNCVQCHNDESPTFEGFDYEARWAEIAHPVPE